MQITIPCVEDIGHPIAVLGPQGGDFLQDVGQLGAGDDPILHVIVGAEFAHGGKGRLAPFPQPQPFFRIRRHCHLAGTIAVTNGLNAIAAGLHLRR